MEVRRASEGMETTVSLAYKCVNGGLEPMVFFAPVKVLLAEGLGDKVPPDDEIMEHILTNVGDMMGIRMAYTAAILPHVTLGKGPAAPSTAGGGGQPKVTNRKRSTSKPSTSSPG